MQSKRSVVAIACLVCCWGVWSCSDDKLPDASQMDGGGSDAVSASDSAVDDAVLSQEDCKGKENGEACDDAESGRICLNESCVTSACNDGFVDANNNEQCEDGNDITGDGCTDCRWDCEAPEDCDDGQLCNGAETCNVDNHTCQAGTAAEDDTACTLADESTGKCNGGACAPPNCGNGTVEDVDGEECDDNNDVAGDGCENDCTWTCETADECDDLDACNGAETCNVDEHTCQDGTEVTCTSEYEGCEGECDSATGDCIFADLDKDGKTCDVDCDDNDSTIFPGAPECKDGKDNDCDKSIADDGDDGDCKCYLDSDGDGYAPAGAKSLDQMECPDGYVSVAPVDLATTDCYPSRSEVSPGQTTYYTTAYCPYKQYCLISKLGDIIGGSYDYNCDENEQQQYPATYTRCVVSVSRLTTCSGAGWDKTVPACGQTGSWIGCTLTIPKIGLPSCAAARAVDKVQACR